MLGRAAARGLKSPTQSHIISASRGYAKAGKPKGTRFIPNVNKPTAPSPVTGAARQTSPGTSIGADKTWKPQDSIKFGGPAAAAGAASNLPNGGSNATGEGEGESESEAQNAEFNRAADPSVNTEPIAQPGPVVEDSPSSPTPSEFANEEFRGPQSARENTAPSSDAPPSTPLPDLRQGIPSTFFEEFNKSAKAAEGKTGEAPLEEKIAAEADAEAAQFASSRRGGQDEEYDRSAYETSIDRRRAKAYRWGYLSLVAFFFTGSAYLSRPYDEDENADGMAPEHLTGWAPASMWARVMGRWSTQKGYYTEPTFGKLLPEVPEAQRPPYTLVLSLEDLMIHSSWTREHGWRTAKRPGIDYFLRYLSQYYELVLFTSVPVAMADPVVKKLDPFRIIQWPLFREGTRYENGEYVKDLSYLNRPLDKTIIIDTKAAHVKNQPENAIVLPKWTGDPKDPHAKDLVALIPFLEYVATMGTEDTRKVLESFKDKEIPAEFARREALAREAFNAQLAEERSRRPKKSIGGLLNKALGIKAPPGGMTLDNETTVAEGLAQGKMLSDQIRERGQREYERLENEIRTNGAKWLKEMEEEEKKFMEGQMKEMRAGWFGGFGGGGKPTSSS